MGFNILVLANGGNGGPYNYKIIVSLVDGTNNEGLFGLEGSMNYTHNNLFHGGEKLMLSFRGGCLFIGSFS